MDNKNNYNTKNNYAYENLKEEIITGRLRPGERIIISDVSKRYNISPMPIREAINRLQQDGFVEVFPHVGARVSPFNIEKHMEIMFIRIELETLATKLATPCINEDTLALLDGLIEQMEECVAASNGKRYGELNSELHLTIYAAGPYQNLFELIQSLIHKSQFSRNVFTNLQERNKASLLEHKAWLAAIKARDAELAAQVLRQQKIVATKLFLDQYDLDEARPWKELFLSLYKDEIEKPRS